MPLLLTQAVNMVRRQQAAARFVAASCDQLSRAFSRLSCFASPPRMLARCLAIVCWDGRMRRSTWIPTSLDPGSTPWRPCLPARWRRLCSQALETFTAIGGNLQPEDAAARSRCAQQGCRLMPRRHVVYTF
jgi:hypothetical protein